MGNYLINNGTSWVNFCNCEINIKNHNNIWQYINPYKCEIKYWTGTEWCLFELNNIFNYERGQAPSLADFETQIGFPLINGHKFGDTIVFDNVGYDVGIDVFDSQNLTGYLKCSALNIASNGFQGNSIVDVYLPLCGFTAVTAFSSNNIERIYAPFLDVSLQSFGDNNIKYLNIPNISSIGGTVGDDGVFFGNTGNTVNIFAPTVHQTSNGGGLEGDLAYLDANNTVTFRWGETEVPDWINTCGTL